MMPLLLVAVRTQRFYTDLHIAEKNFKCNVFWKKGDHCVDIFVRHSLTIYELHIYELIKFVPKSMVYTSNIFAKNCFN